MSTHAFIGVACDDGVRYVYCHSDGYPSYVGRILKESYIDFLKVCSLIKGGDLSSLGRDIGEKHSFDRYDPSICTYYARDRGEKGCEYSLVTEAEYHECCEDFEYGYLFKDGEWLLYNDVTNTFEPY